MATMANGYKNGLVKNNFRQAPTFPLIIRNLFRLHDDISVRQSLEFKVEF